MGSRSKRGRISKAKQACKPQLSSTSPTPPTPSEASKAPTRGLEHFSESEVKRFTDGNGTEFVTIIASALDGLAQHCLEVTKRAEELEAELGARDKQVEAMRSSLTSTVEDWCSSIKPMFATNPPGDTDPQAQLQVLHFQNKALTSSAEEYYAEVERLREVVEKKDAMINLFRQKTEVLGSDFESAKERADNYKVCLDTCEVRRLMPLA